MENTLLLTLSVAPQKTRMRILHPVLELGFLNQPVGRAFVFFGIYALMHFLEIEV